MSASFKRKRRARTMLEIATLPEASSLRNLRKRWEDSEIILPRKKPKKRRKRRRKQTPKEAESQKERCDFSETRMGMLLRYCCRTEYNVLTAMSSELKVQVSPELIEKVSYSSHNPIFKSREFRVALLDFKVNGYVKFAGNVADEEIKMIVSKLKERGLE